MTALILAVLQGYLTLTEALVLLVALVLSAIVASAAFVIRRLSKRVDDEITVQRRKDPTP